MPPFNNQMSRTANSSTIPSFLLKALGNVRKAKFVAATNTPAEPTPEAKPIVRVASVNILPLSGIEGRKLVAHGAGVYEDPENHSIWYKEGNFLKRRQEDIDRIITDYVSSKA